MLHEMDIELMNATRHEVTQLRLKPLTLVRTVLGAEDPFTGRKTTSKVNSEVLGTWMVLTGGGMGGGGDYEFVDGVKVQSGDVVANVSTDYDVTGVEEVIRLGKRYSVRALEPMGLGEFNRYFILLRRIS